VTFNFCPSCSSCPGFLRRDPDHETGAPEWPVPHRRLLHGPAVGGSAPLPPHPLHLHGHLLLLGFAGQRSRKIFLVNPDHYPSCPGKHTDYYPSCLSKSYPLLL